MNHSRDIRPDAVSPKLGIISDVKDPATVAAFDPLARLLLHLARRRRERLSQQRKEEGPDRQG